MYHKILTVFSIIVCFASISNGQIKNSLPDDFNRDGILPPSWYPNWGNCNSTVEVEDIINDREILIYPNPVKSLFIIEIKQGGLHKIEITSLNGQQLYTGEMKGTTQQLDLSSFQKGVYLITIRSKDFVTTRKIIRL